MGLILRNNAIIKNLVIGGTGGSGGEGGGGGGINTTGLFLHYDIGDTSSYPGSGTTLTNLANTDSGYNATINNTPTYNGSGASAYLSVSTNSQITANLGSLLDGVTAHTTISHWVRPTGSGAAQLFRRYDGNWPIQFGSVSGFWDIHSDGNITAQYWGQDRTSRWQTLNINGTYNNTWVNIVMTYGPSGGVRLYLNGTEDTGQALTTNYGSGTNTLDAINDFEIMHPKTYMEFAHFAYYTRELTASEVSSNFDALKTRYGY